MRLLRLSNTGELSLTREFVGDDIIPPYAILSHTWETNEKEFSFGDLMSGTGKSKPGYRKIHLCGKQAQQDGLHYFWVDTCCINKSNSTELSYAINSMFLWYRNATRCYVYLADTITPVSDDNQGSHPELGTARFTESRWFKRGWTLQELIAPQSVEFFSAQWERLGNKRSLHQQIHQITGIPKSALENAPLSQFSVQERLSWIHHRQTQREEDLAYSLLGIFNVSMPPIYGEGKERAFKRLQEEIDKDLKSQMQKQTPVNNLQSTEAESEDNALLHFFTNVKLFYNIAFAPLFLFFFWSTMGFGELPDEVLWSAFIASFIETFFTYQFGLNLPFVLRVVTFALLQNFVILVFYIVS